jgi:NAD(P)-dependent dehydrogenase (short-subunit alcohol dehydrogenase family)
MRIVVVGGTGTIGSAVAEALADRHEVVRAAHTDGDVQVDIEDRASIEALYAQIGRIDAVVCAAGGAGSRPVDIIEDDHFTRGIDSKLMGQVNLVRSGLPHLAEGGSFPLTSGITGRHPQPGTVGLAMINGALESFARAAALDMPRGIRINVVSPGWVTETADAARRHLEAADHEQAAARLEALERWWKEAPSVPAATVARAYVESVEGSRSGETLDPYDFQESTG